MATTLQDQIRKRAVELLLSEPNGIRYMALVRRIKEDPKFKNHAICGAIWNLDSVVPAEVYKASRGLFRAVKFRDAEPAQLAASAGVPAQVAEEEQLREEKFYEPFADWITGELEECTKAIPLGGNSFKDKWGTPDVLGIREPRKSDIVKPPTEIVAAELKIEKSGLGRVDKPIDARIAS